MIFPVILCGGSGSRLWPLSRASFPKQFAPLSGDRSLFRQALARAAAPGHAAPVVVTADPFRFIVAGQMAEEGARGTILIEPAPRNTAPAILAAALHIAARDSDALMLVMPSDQVIDDAAVFHAAVGAGAPQARAGGLVTFGVAPDRPATGYGWLRPGGALAEGAAVPLAGFVEKPDLATAQAMLAEGGHLWNAGIFLFTARAFIAACAAHAPALLAPVRAAVEGVAPDLGFLRLAAAPWAEVEDISVDYAVMEHATDRWVVPLGCGWSDLGGWNAVWQGQGPDAKGVATHGPATAIDCENTLLRSENPDLRLVGLGLSDIVAVAMPDAVLVARKSDSQRVRAAVEALRAEGAPQADAFPREHRPWGWFETLAGGERFQVKRIVVNPGGRLSLQSHLHRAEHWIVVRGTARVTIGEDEQLVSENQSVYVPLGQRHRLENPGKVPVVLIEVQTGAYLGEDDITRFEDAYARGTP